MSHYLTSDEAYGLLSTIFELPKGATRLTITLELKELAVVTVTTIGRRTDVNGAPEPITEKWLLVKPEKKGD